MSLFTKSIQKTPNKSDGIRVCIMRRPDKKAIYDIWMPILAPSHFLLDNYHNKKIKWKEFEKLFTSEVLLKNQHHIRLLTCMAEKFPITILCWEKKPNKCHRRLVAEECKRINTYLKVRIK